MEPALRADFALVNAFMADRKPDAIFMAAAKVGPLSPKTTVCTSSMDAPTTSSEACRKARSRSETRPTVVPTVEQRGIQWYAARPEVSGSESHCGLFAVWMVAQCRNGDNVMLLPNWMLARKPA